MIQASQAFDAFHKQNILIIGDVMIDRYLTGKVSRISPEAPVPVVHLQDSDNRLGGAANVALNLKALGATPYLCSVIGEGSNADRFLQ
ncbi:MAG TPA: PfkB family carbohydrate kinase, partial [Saprospiraceae bacterium]|nr:PfkB family carbohydrate kinase [Saprospiraceae bacterium]